MHMHEFLQATQCLQFMNHWVVLSKMREELLPQMMTGVGDVASGLYERAVVAKPLRFRHLWDGINTHDDGQDIGALHPACLKPGDLQQPISVVESNDANRLCVHG